MCNLYAMMRSADEMRRLFADLSPVDLLGNLPAMPEVYPDYSAPILRTGEAGPELARARWGLPTPPQFLTGRNTDRGVTNVRNTSSPHWRRWLGPANRCLVPLTSFAEPNPAGGNAWFDLPDEVPAVFAGIHVRGWTSTRKLKDGPTTDDLFAFLTTLPNGEVRPVHPKAMPVILVDRADWHTWLTAPWPEAAQLQRPLRDSILTRR
jgi:putative SOS response-associated peptidase YedK